MLCTKGVGLEIAQAHPINAPDITAAEIHETSVAFGALAANPLLLAVARKLTTS